MRARFWQVTEYLTMLKRLSGNRLHDYCLKNMGKGDYGYRVAIRMPLTDEWEIMEIPSKFVKQKCIPIFVQTKLDYWVRMRALMERMRDYGAMSGDLNPITPEERSIFGARVMEPNPIFPRMTKARARAEYDNYWDDFREGKL